MQSFQKCSELSRSILKVIRFNFKNKNFKSKNLTSLSGGNQVDGSPPAFSTMRRGREALFENWKMNSPNPFNLFINLFQIVLRTTRSRSDWRVTTMIPDDSWPLLFTKIDNLKKLNFYDHCTRQLWCSCFVKYLHSLPENKTADTSYIAEQ